MTVLTAAREFAVCACVHTTRHWNAYYIIGGCSSCIRDARMCTSTFHLLLQVERNLQDAMQVVRNVMIDPRLVPGGGATEMALAQALNEKAKSVSGVQQWPYMAVSRALEIIPRTLLQNCGANTIRVLTTLRVHFSTRCTVYTVWCVHACVCVSSMTCYAVLFAGQACVWGQGV